MGGNVGHSYLDSVEMFNPKNNTWSILTASMNLGRSNAAVAVIDKPSWFIS